MHLRPSLKCWGPRVGPPDPAARPATPENPHKLLPKNPALTFIEFPHVVECMVHGFKMFQDRNTETHRSTFHTRT